MSATEAAYLIVCGAFGSLFGSFLNVVIHRMPERKSLVLPGSHCPSCETPIRWYDNIPILSWLALRGRCRHCGAGISPRYLFVEALTAALTAAVAWRHLVGGDGPRWGLFFSTLFLVYALIPVTFIDLKHRIIPDRITKPGMVVGLVLSLLVPELHRHSPLVDALRDFGNRPGLIAVLISLTGLAVGFGTIWLMGVAGKALFKKDSMGFGDVKLMGMVGAFVGPVGVLLVILMGCVAGSVVGILSYLVTRSHYIPFGPFLSLGGLLVIFFRPEVVHFFTVTYPALFR